MAHPTARWTDPDKIIRDILWRDIADATRYARGRLLDVGCGTKPYRALFGDAVKEYVGVDKYSRKAEIRNDFLTMPIHSSSYDTILCTQVLEHVPYPETLVKKTYRVLRPGGYLILTAPLVGSLHEEPRDYYRFTSYGLTRMMKDAGYTVTYVKGQGDWITTAATLWAFYLESTLNKYLLRYPKKLAIAFLLLGAHMLSHLPDRFTKPEKCPMNYIVVARKKV